LNSIEPSVAVDPRNPLDAVIAFNHLDGGVSCGWWESTDGGASKPVVGTLQLPKGFHPRGDPWVRYSPNGELFYSCLGDSDPISVGPLTHRKVGVFVGVSGPTTDSA